MTDSYSHFGLANLWFHMLCILELYIYISYIPILYEQNFYKHLRKSEKREYKGNKKIKDKNKTHICFDIEGNKNYSFYFSKEKAIINWLLYYRELINKFSLLYFILFLLKA